MANGTGQPKRKRKEVIFEAVFAEKEEPGLWEAVDRYLGTFQFFDRWWRNANGNLKKAA